MLAGSVRRVGKTAGVKRAGGVLQQSFSPDRAAACRRTMHAHRSLQMQPKSTLGLYGAGLAPTLIGAGLVNWSGSLWPLALGAACSLMVTAQVVRRVWLRGRAR